MIRKRIIQPLNARPPVYLQMTGIYELQRRFMSLGIHSKKKNKNFAYQSDYMQHTHWMVHPTRAKVEYDQINKVFRAYPFVSAGDFFRDKLYWSLPTFAVDLIWNRYISRSALIHNRVPHYIACLEGDMPDYARIRQELQSNARVDYLISSQRSTMTYNHIFLKCFAMWIMVHYSEVAYHLNLFSIDLLHPSGWGMFSWITTLTEYILGIKEFIRSNGGVIVECLREGLATSTSTPPVQDAILAADGDLPITYITADTPIGNEDGLLPLEEQPHSTSSRLMNMITVFAVGACLFTLWKLELDVCLYDKAESLADTIPSVVVKHHPEIKKLAIRAFM